jgi:hypothetical protein
MRTAQLEVAHFGMEEALMPCNGSNTPAVDRQARSHADCPRLAEASIEWTTCMLASV